MTTARRASGRGPSGNARLTALTGAVLVVLLAFEGGTLIALGPLLPVHVFIGMALIPPVLLKLATTAYRFGRYYSGDRAYRTAGPPHPVLRALGPLVIAATFALLGTGVAMIALGPRDGWLVGLHKASFVVWIAVTAVHVLGHAVSVPGLVASDVSGPTERRYGAALRRFALAGALVGGLVLATTTVQYASAWSSVVG